MKLLFLTLLYSIQSLGTCLANESNAVYKNLDAAKTKAIIAKFTKEKKTLLIIDVRTKEEYDREHFPKAKLINFFGSNFEKSSRDSIRIRPIFCIVSPEAGVEELSKK